MKKLNFKNLESLKNEKFSISKEEQNQILGGYDPAISYSYEYYLTNIGDRYVNDQMKTDVCIS